MKKIFYRPEIFATTLIWLCLGALSHNLTAQYPTPDLSFNSTGKWFYSDGSSYELFTDILIDANGRIILVGYTNYDPNEGGKNRGVVYRLMPNGTPDGTYGQNGKVYIDFSSSTDEIQGAAFDNEGNIILCGQTNIASGVVYKVLGTSGSLDPGFGTAGRVVISGATELNDVAVLSDGKIVAAGWGPYSSSDDDILVARLLANGTPDATWGTNGFRLYGTTEDEYANELVIQPDGNIVVSGYQSRCSSDNCLDPIITKVLANGQLDANFGIKVVSEAKNEAKAYNVALQHINGEARILLSGYHEPSTDDYQGFIKRYRDNGNPDGSFNNSPTGFVSLSDMAGCIMSVQSDNKILLASYRVYFVGSNIYFGLRLMRRNADGTLDATFGNNGIYDDQISGFLDGAEVIKPVGNKLYVVGGVFPYQNNYTDADGFVARYNIGTSSTSAQDLAESLGIKIYPNPTTQYLTINSPSTTLRQVEVINAEGRLFIERYDIRGNIPIVFDLSDLPPGQYFVKVIPEGNDQALALPITKL